MSEKNNNIIPCIPRKILKPTQIFTNDGKKNVPHNLKHIHCRAQDLYNCFLSAAAQTPI